MFKTQNDTYGKAYQWLLEDQSNKNAYRDGNLELRYILAVLFYTTNGTDWYDNENWLSLDDECNWYGVSCEWGK